MAVRVRKESGNIVCAAFSEAEEGDVYVNDAVHYWLASIGLLVTNDEGDTWTILTEKE